MARGTSARGGAGARGNARGARGSTRGNAGGRSNARGRGAGRGAAASSVADTVNGLLTQFAAAQLAAFRNDPVAFLGPLAAPTGVPNGRLHNQGELRVAMRAEAAAARNDPDSRPTNRAPANPPATQPAVADAAPLFTNPTAAIDDSQYHPSQVDPANPEANVSFPRTATYLLNEMDRSDRNPAVKAQTTTRPRARPMDWGCMCGDLSCSQNLTNSAMAKVTDPTFWGWACRHKLVYKVAFCTKRARATRGGNIVGHSDLMKCRYSKAKKRHQCPACKATVAPNGPVGNGFGRSNLRQVMQCIVGLVNGNTAKTIDGEAGLSPQTLTEIHHKFDYMLAGVAFNRIDKAKNTLTRIHADEFVVGRTMYHRGDPVSQSGQQWYQSIAQLDDEGRCAQFFIRPVANRTIETLDSWIFDLVKDGAIVNTDCFSSYINLRQYCASRGKTITHNMVNHSVGFKNEFGEHTNVVECMHHHVRTIIKNGVGEDPALRAARLMAASILCQPRTDKLVKAFRALREVAVNGCTFDDLYTNGILAVVGKAVTTRVRHRLKMKGKERMFILEHEWDLLDSDDDGYRHMIDKPTTARAVEVRETADVGTQTTVTFAKYHIRGYDIDNDVVYYEGDDDTAYPVDHQPAAAQPAAALPRRPYITPIFDSASENRLPAAGNPLFHEITDLTGDLSTLTISESVVYVKEERNEEAFAVEESVDDEELDDDEEFEELDEDEEDAQDGAQVSYRPVFRENMRVGYIEGPSQRPMVFSFNFNSDDEASNATGRGASKRRRSI